MSALGGGPQGPSNLVVVFYIVLNIASALGIVFANRIVLVSYGFRCVTALTMFHSITTWVSMRLFAKIGFFEARTLPNWDMVPLALGYVGYVVLSNMSLRLNSVSLFQIFKLAIAPTVMALEFLMLGISRTRLEVASVALVCCGIFFATVTEPVSLRDSIAGVVVGLAGTLVTGMYQVMVQGKQKELKANSSQLLLAYSPHAIGLLVVLTPALDPVGWSPASRTAGTLLGFSYTWDACAALVLSALLGVLVSLSTFLVIGATSSLTFNIVGHLKTVLIFTGACLLFGESMPAKRLLGLVITMSGIAWYTYLRMRDGAAGSSTPAKALAASIANGTAAQLEDGVLEKRPLLGDSTFRDKAHAKATPPGTPRFGVLWSSAMQQDEFRSVGVGGDSALSPGSASTAQAVHRGDKSVSAGGANGGAPGGLAPLRTGQSPQQNGSGAMARGAYVSLETKDLGSSSSPRHNSPRVRSPGNGLGGTSPNSGNGNGNAPAATAQERAAAFTRRAVDGVMGYLNSHLKRLADR